MLTHVTMALLFRKCGINYKETLSYNYHLQESKSRLRNQGGTQASVSPSTPTDHGHLAPTEAQSQRGQDRFHLHP